MGDPGDFSSRGGYTPINKELWDSLDDMTKIAEKVITRYGIEMDRATLRIRQKELEKAKRMLDKYKPRIKR